MVDLILGIANSALALQLIITGIIALALDLILKI